MRKKHYSYRHGGITRLPPKKAKSYAQVIAEKNRRDSKRTSGKLEDAKRRYHSGGTIRKHEHGRGPGQHPVAGYPEDFIRHVMNRNVSITGTGGNAFMAGADTTYWNPETGEESYMSPSARALYERGGSYDPFVEDEKRMQERVNAAKEKDTFYMFTPEGKALDQAQSDLENERRQRDLAMVRQYSREKPHSVPQDIRRHWGGDPRTAEEGGYSDMPLAERRAGAEEVIGNMLEKRGEASIGILNSARMRDLLSDALGPATVDSVLAERMFGPTAPGGRALYLGGNPDRPETREREPYWRREGWKSGDQQRASGGIIGLQYGGGVPQFQGYGGPGQMQVRQEFLAPEVRQQYGQLTDAIMQAGTRPLQQFGPGVAGFTDMEAAAQAGIGAYGRGQGPQGTLQAASTYGQAAQGIGSMIPQQQALAAQYGAMAPQALQQAQAGATGMQNLAGRAELQGQLAGAGMRQTGAAAQAEQQAAGAGQAAAGQAAAQQQQQLGAEQQRRGAVAQTQMQGLGQQAQQAGQAALGAQQGFGTGMTGMGTAAQQLGQTAMGQMGQTGQQSQQQAQQAAERMRQIGGQAPQLQKGADMSDYMSQYTKGVTDPQLQQLLEFQKMQGQELGSQAAQAGAFGGSRQGIQAGIQAGDISQQAAEIIGAGQQKAFESAQQAFQADRAAQQQAQQTGLSAEQQAAATQAGAQGQALQAQQAGVGAAQAGGAQQMQAQQQAAGMADVGTGRQMQGLQAQVGATGQGIQFGQQGLEAQRAAAQVGAGQQQQGLAAQQAAAAQGAQFGLQGQQQGFQAAQAGTQLGLSGLQAAQQAGQQGFGTAANLMQGQQGAMGAQMGAYGQLAGIAGGQQQLGGAQQQQQMARLRMMEQAGMRQRQLGQAGLDYQRQQFQERQQYPQQQIGWMNQQLGALPYQSTVMQGSYSPQAGPVSSLMGAGIQGAGLWNAYQGQQGGRAQEPITGGGG